MSANKKITILSNMIQSIEKKSTVKRNRDLNPILRPCDWPSCELEGIHRAPKSQGNLREYNWFCLEHVRIYNSAWNYYEGMSIEEINNIIRSDTTWNRPSWPLGDSQTPSPKSNNLESSRPDAFGINYGELNDPFGLFRSETYCKKSIGEDTQKALSKKERKALSALGFDALVRMSELKARYKLLVKRYHPDITGGNKKLEERFKQINEAYEIVRIKLMNN